MHVFNVFLVVDVSRCLCCVGFVFVSCYFLEAIGGTLALSHVTRVVLATLVCAVSLAPFAGHRLTPVRLRFFVLLFCIWQGLRICVCYIVLSFGVFLALLLSRLLYFESCAVSLLFSFVFIFLRALYQSTRRWPG